MFSENGSTLVVFSHPNHELAIFGLVQSLRPRLVYLTDGGGEKRVEQTRQGLKSIDLLDHAHFLNYTEKSFYEALLACDLKFYEEVAGQLRTLFQVIRPRQILCDAIEFYNPVHDMSLPLVRAALHEPSDAEIFEVPLVHQKSTEADAYELQRLPTSRRGEQIEFHLSPQELTAKVRARDQIYTLLVDQMGPILLQPPLTHFALEVIAPACSSIPKPGSDNFLRYERRAEILLGHGKIERKITYAEHYLPIATSLNSHRYDKPALF